MRASVTSLTKKFISTFFAATLVMGLVPAAAFAANEDNGNDESTNSVISAEASDSERSGAISPSEDTQDESPDLVISSEGEKSDSDPSSVGAEPAPRDGKDATEDNVQAPGDDNPAMSIPAATERINEDVMLTTPVAQQETTKNYFLAQTLESTRTIPIVSANLPLDKGPIDIEVVEPNAEGEGSNTSEEEDGESSEDDPDSEDLATTDDFTDGVISTEASNSERSGEISTPVAAASTVIGSFTYLGMTYAIEPGGETVALVAVDYNQLPETFIEKQIIAIPETVTPDDIDYYSVTRIADHAFASLTKENANEDYKGCLALFSDEELLNEAGIDATEVEAFLNPESDMIDIDGDGETDGPANPLKDCTGILAVGIPASVTSIGDEAFAGSDTLQYLVVSEDNPSYASYDGALYSADLTNLRLIPEGRVGAVRVAPSATDVSPEAFSHCPSVTTLVADPESEMLTSLREWLRPTSFRVISKENDGLNIASISNLGLLDRVGVQSPLVSCTVSVPFSVATSSTFSAPSPFRSENWRIYILDVKNTRVYRTQQGYNTSSRKWVSSGAGLQSWASTRENTHCCDYEVSNADTPENADRAWIYNGTAVIPLQNFTSATAYDLYKNLYSGNSNNNDVKTAVVYWIQVTDQDGNRTGARMKSWDLATEHHDLSPGVGSGAFVLFINGAENRTLSFNGNGGTSSKSSISATAGSLITLPTATRAGYSCTGWYTATSGGTLYGAPGAQVYAPTAAFATGVLGYTDDYYAQWTASTYTVTYNANGGTGNAYASSHTYGIAKNLSANAFTAPTGKYFTGWNTAANGTGTAYAATQSVSNLTSTDKGNVNLYAQWAWNPYTVTYNANGGSANANTSNKTTYTSSHVYNTAKNLTTNYFTAPTGKYFTGWNTAANGTGTGYSATQSVSNLTTTYNGNVNLYAQWAWNPYTVTYNANGGSANASTGNKTTYTSSHTYNTAKNLTTNYFTPPTGKYFTGWNTAANGTGTGYSATQSVSNLTTTYNGNVNLYAQWAWNPYTVTYNANGGSANANTGNKTTYTSSHVYNTAKNLTTNYFTPPTGKHFTCWHTAANAPGTSYTATESVINLTTTYNGNVNLYAQWSWNIATVKYNANGGGGTMADTTHTYGTASTLRANSFTAPAGKHFTGWNTAANGTGVAYSNSQNMTNHTLGNGTTTTLYAQWAYNTATVKYNANTGSGTMADTTHTYGTASSLRANSFTAPTGKHFVNWNTAANGTGTAYTNSQNMTNHSLGHGTTTTLYAQWSWNTYTVTYNPNTGGGSAYTSNHTYNTAQNLSNNRFTAPTGKHFIGWNTQADGKGTAYTETQSVNNLTATNGGNINLYAQWDNNVYKVKFDANGGTGGLTGPIDVTYSLAMPTLTGDWKPSLGGYEFNGWWDTDAKTDGKQYYKADGTSANPWNKTDEVTTLYARWSRMPFHAITLKDSRLGDGKDDKSIWYWPSHGFTPSNPNEFPTDGTRDDEIRIVKKSDANPSIVAPPTYADYEFLGYYDKPDGEGGTQKIDAKGNLLTEETITSATTWYAHWKRLGSNVELKANYGEGMIAKDIVQGTDKIEHVAFEKDFATPLGENTTRIEEIAKTPTRVGYTFMGYFTEPNPEHKTEVELKDYAGKLWIDADGNLVEEKWLSEEDWKKAPTNLVDKGAITLYAAWQLDDCIVKFEIEENLEDDTERVYVPEGSTALDDRIWHYNKNMSDKLPVPGEATFTRNGYDFGGWYYLKDGKIETQVCDKDGVPTDVLKPWSDPTENVTLYAYWTPRTYALAFDPAFPGDEGVAEVYEGETSIKGIKYDDSLTLVSPDFGAYDFAGWYVGVPDGAGGWEASDVPFADWTLRNGTEVTGLHTTAVTEKSAGVYEGRFTPHDPLVGQTYDAEALEPAVIHVVAQWEKPVQRTMRFYAGVPGESVEASKIAPIEEDYDFAKAYDFPSTWLPSYVKDGWKCRGWAEVGTKEAAMELLKSGDQEPEDYAGVTGIEAKVTREGYRDLYFVAKWTICPLSVTLESEGDDDAYRVLASDGFHDEVTSGDARSWMDASKRESGDERIYIAAYDVRATPFTLPDLARRGYDFKGWRLKGKQVDPVKRLVVDPADQAKLEADHDWVFEPVFEEITYEIVLKPNGGGLEEQTHERTYTQDFTFYCPVALYTGSVFSSWATKEWEPLNPGTGDGSFRKFHDGMTVSMAPATKEDGEHVFGLTDLIEDGIEHVDDAPRTITLYGIWFDGFIKVDVPLTVNMAIDTETGDVVAAKTPLAPTKENADTVYTVESLHYEPVSTDKGVPFEGANEVYFSIYPGLEFANETDAYYFLHKGKVGEKGAVTYVSPDGEKTATPLLVKLGSTDPSSRLYTRTKLPDDYTFRNMTLGDTTLNEASGFRSFTYDDPLDVYYGIHFADSATWKSTLQKFAFQENADHWTLPRNDAGNAVNDSEGRKAGWSSDRVDIAKVRYTLSMKAKTPVEDEATS